MKITYIFHSCFIVEIGQKVLIFDYYDGDLPKFTSDKKLYFFSSHGHPDHFVEEIFHLGQAAKERKYILAEDITARPSSNDEVLSVTENETYILDGLVIHTIHSTDMGVAFLVEVDGKYIYHAGDLNWWHWDGEADAFNSQMEADYKKEIQKIAAMHKHIHVAFVPLDQRLDYAYDYGIKYFMEHIEVEKVIPMHFFSENFEICRKVCVENQNFEHCYGELVPIEHLYQEFEF